MSSPLKHTISAETGRALRAYIEHPNGPASQAADILTAAGIFLPIEETTAPTGRATCRLCVLPIEQGATVIRFGFDVYRAPRGGFGKLTTALIHRRFCCAPREEDSPVPSSSPRAEGDGGNRNPLGPEGAA